MALLLTVLKLHLPELVLIRCKSSAFDLIFYIQQRNEVYRMLVGSVREPETSEKAECIFVI